MAGKHKHPCYKQYVPRETLDKLRDAANVTGMPMQVLVRKAIDRLLRDVDKAVAAANNEL